MSGGAGVSPGDEAGASGAAPGEAEVLVVLTAIPALEEPLTDWLLVRGHARGAGFSSLRIGGHSSRLEHLSPAEQVSGRRRGVQFQVVMVRDDVDDFLADLQTAFAGADLHYWVVPVLRSGRLKPR